MPYLDVANDITPDGPLDSIRTSPAMHPMGENSCLFGSTVHELVERLARTESCMAAQTEDLFHIKELLESLHDRVSRLEFGAGHVSMQEQALADATRMPNGYAAQIVELGLIDTSEVSGAKSGNIDALESDASRLPLPTEFLDRPIKKTNFASPNQKASADGVSSKGADLTAQADPMGRASSPSNIVLSSEKSIRAPSNRRRSEGADHTARADHLVRVSSLSNSNSSTSLASSIIENVSRWWGNKTTTFMTYSKFGTYSEEAWCFLNLEASRVAPVMPSSWEGPVIAFHSGLAFADSISLVVAALLNIGFQSLCMLIVLRLFLVPELPDVEDVRTWRYTYAHDYKHLSEVSVTSLASAVCAGDNSLIVSRGQQEVRKLIQHYHQTFELFDFTIGRTLCLLMMLFWYLCVLPEFPRIIGFGWALTGTLGTRTKILYHAGETMAFELIQVGMLRYVTIMLLLAIRMAIAASLLIVGSVWLANTVNTRDLVLNSAALYVVLMVDELFYDNFVTPRSRCMIEQLRPLRGPVGLFNFLIPFLGLVGSGAFLVWMRFWKLEQVSQDMENINDVMCGSLQDFVAAQDAVGLSFVLKTEPYKRGAQKMTSKLINEVVETGTSESAAFPVTLSQFQHHVLQSLSMKTEWFANSFMRGVCRDIFPIPETDRSEWGQVTSKFISAPLEYSYDVSEVQDCAELAHRCNDPRFNLLRLSCPVTCGCHDPLSGLFLNGITAGCATSVCQSSGAYLQAQSRACEDIAAVALTPAWHKFWEGWFAEVNNTDELPLDMIMPHVEAIRRYGCSAFTDVPQDVGMFRRQAFCTSTQRHTSVAVFCPKTCGCNSETVAGCPSSCV